MDIGISLGVDAVSALDIAEGRRRLPLLSIRKRASSSIADNISNPTSPFGPSIST